MCGGEVVMYVATRRYGSVISTVGWCQSSQTGSLVSFVLSRCVWRIRIRSQVSQSRRKEMQRKADPRFWGKAKR